MYLPDRDLEFAVQTGQLIVDPAPTEYDTTSIDLHLDTIEEAKVWDVGAFARKQKESGNQPWVGVGGFIYEAFARDYHRPIPTDPEQPVFRDGGRVVLKPNGFFLWQTKEKVGTPEENPRLICFIDGKSTKARLGLVIHMTAPTIHAGWWGKVTLEIGNLGPFTLALKEGEAVAQIVVATITSPPVGKKKVRGVRIGQGTVGGQAGATGAPAGSDQPR
jgi:dCTP deaminase